eukprot:gb/GFBE01009412.1/.p1 GENE.gb/GFBE01009412.1/~~gb/GFBE01009412.1/.p1  ORF type:complete len:247 (+),score=62.71 gb/GFBE01009412.1/:3-743(+)
MSLAFLALTALASTATAAHYVPKNVQGVQVLKDLTNGKFQVLPSSGVAYRLSKSLEDRDPSQGADHNQILYGRDEADWVQVLKAAKMVYLPKSVGNVQVLKDLGSGNFQVLPKSGVAYRLSKDLEDRDGGRGADHEHTIYGIDEGDWVKTERLEKPGTVFFLPKEVAGKQVLTALPRNQFQVLPAPGLAFRRSRDLEDRDSRHGLDGNAVFEATDEGDWVEIRAVMVDGAMMGIEEYLARGHKTEL